MTLVVEIYSMLTKCSTQCTENFSNKLIFKGGGGGHFQSFNFKGGGAYVWPLVPTPMSDMGYSGWYGISYISFYHPRASILRALLISLHIILCVGELVDKAWKSPIIANNMGTISSNMISITCCSLIRCQWPFPWVQQPQLIVTVHSIHWS